MVSLIIRITRFISIRIIRIMNMMKLKDFKDKVYMKKVFFIIYIKKKRLFG